MYIVGKSLLGNQNALLNNQRNIFNTDRINQSIAKKAEQSSAEKNGGRPNKDRVTISPQSRVMDMINSLNDRKMDIINRKNEFLVRAEEKGLSDEEILAKQSLFDEQINAVDDQIAQLKAKQMEEILKQKEEKDKDDQPKTSEEIQKEKMENLNDISVSHDNMEKIDAIKEKVEGEIRTTEQELELDNENLRPTRLPGGPINPKGYIWGSRHAVNKKVERLADLRGRLENLQKEFVDEAEYSEDKIIKNEELSAEELEAKLLENSAENAEKLTEVREEEIYEEKVSEKNDESDIEDKSENE